jgi:hypothetical protein
MDLSGPGVVQAVHTAANAYARIRFARGLAIERGAAGDGDSMRMNVPRTPTGELYISVTLGAPYALGDLAADDGLTRREPMNRGCTECTRRRSCSTSDEFTLRLRPA